MSRALSKPSDSVSARPPHMPHVKNTLLLLQSNSKAPKVMVEELMLLMTVSKVAISNLQASEILASSAASDAIPDDETGRWNPTKSRKLHAFCVVWEVKM